MKRFIVGLSLLICQLGTAEDAWKKDYWAWGQGTTTNDAANAATSAARPAILALRLECDASQGILGTSSKYGTCAKNDDPMFCKYGCYDCPVYGTGTCKIDTTTDIKVGALVEAIIDADMWSGNKIVDHVKKGDRFHIRQINGQWATLEALDGAYPNGWIKKKDIVRASAP